MYADEVRDPRMETNCKFTVNKTPQRELIRRIVDDAPGPIRRVVKMQREGPYVRPGRGPRGSRADSQQERTEGNSRNDAGEGRRSVIDSVSGRRRFTQETPAAKPSPENPWLHDKFLEAQEEEHGGARSFGGRNERRSGGEHRTQRYTVVVSDRKTQSRSTEARGRPAANSSSDAWQHDRYQEYERANGTSRGPPRTRDLELTSARTSGTVVTIENIAEDITRDLVHELCGKFGANQVVRFRPTRGREMGMAEVSFSRRQDAVTAVREIDGNELDGDGHILEARMGQATPRHPRSETQARARAVAPPTSARSSILPRRRTGAMYMDE